MRTYELIVVLNTSQGDDAVNAEFERIQGLVASQGEIKDIDVWGRRRLAYPIQDETEGHYALIHFQAEPEGPKEIERVLRISEPVLRYLIVLADGETTTRTPDDDESSSAEAPGKD